MKTLILLVVISLLSSCSQNSKTDCEIHFEVPKNTINFDGIVTDVKVSNNMLKVSVSNLRNDTIYFAAPHLMFVKETIKQDDELPIVVKPFIPNIITEQVISYYIPKKDKKEIISIDSSKTRDMKQYEFKLNPRGKFVTEYFFNCEESDPEKYKVFFLESNRFDSIKYKKIRYPENMYIIVKNQKYEKTDK